MTWLTWRRYLLWTPTVIGALVGAWLLLKDIPQGQSVVTLVFTTLFGLILTGVATALSTESHRISDLTARKFHEAVTVTLGDIPDAIAVQALYGGEMGPLLRLHLTDAKERIHKAKAGYQSEGKIPLTTPESYEAIVRGMKRAGSIKILDNDIRRWYELLDCMKEDCELKNLTSATFNYSRTILSDVGKRARNDKSLQGVTRTFLVCNNHVDCLTDGDLGLLQGGEDITKTSEATQVLLCIWRFEEWCRKQRQAKLLPEIPFESKVLFWGSCPQTLKDQVYTFKDFVVLDDEMCFQEDLVPTDQASEFSSRDSQSYILVNHHTESHVHKMTEFYDEALTAAVAAMDNKVRPFKEYVGKVPEVLVASY